MSLAFYMDVHVPRAIARALRIRGINVLTAQEDGTAEFDDSPMLDRACDLGHILFTRDEDFLIEADARERRGEPFGGIIYAHQLRVSIGQCIADLELIGEAGDAEELSDRIWRLPLR